DKATIEIPSPFHGKVTELHAREGETVKVGQLLVSAEAEGGAAKSTAVAKTPSAPKTSAPSQPAASSVAPMGASANGGSVSAAPSARRFAREAGVDVGNVPGSGPQGRVMKE